MNRWNPYRLVDIFGQLEMPVLEEDFLERDLQKEKFAAKEPKRRWNKRRIAIWSGVAAGSLALTGVAVFFARRTFANRAAA